MLSPIYCDMFSLLSTLTPHIAEPSGREPSGRLLASLLLVSALLTLTLAVAGCGGAGSNEENSGGDEKGSDGPSLSAPAVPSGLEATSGDSEIGLSWEAVDEANAYRVYRGTSSGVDTSSSALETDVSSTDYTDGTAENGQTYYYVVTAVAEEDGETAESGASNEVEKTPFSDPPNRP